MQAHALVREDLGLIHPLAYGDARTDGTLRAALDDPENTGRGLLLTPGVWTIAADLTIPDDHPVHRGAGASVAVAAGVTLTIARLVDAGLEGEQGAPGDPVSWQSGPGSLIIESRLTLQDARVINSTVGSLPPPGHAGRTRYVTDDVGGLHLDTGVRWVQVRGMHVNAQELGLWPLNTPAQNASALQAIFARMGGLGGVCHVPRGHYPCDPFVLPYGISLQGDSMWDPTRDSGTWFEITALSAPFCLMFGQCAVKGLSFYYPAQVTGGAPVVYPPTIELGNSHERFLIEQCFFQNPYTAIAATGNSNHTYLTVDRCIGYPLKVGIDVDGSLDIDRLDRVHWNPNNWPEAQPSLHAWVNANAAGFSIGRADWLRMHNCFAYGYNAGLEFVDKALGACFEASVVSCGFDACRFPIFVSGSAWGVKLISCAVVGFDPHVPTFPASGVLVSSNNTHAGTVSISNLEVWGTRAHGVYIQRGNAVHVTNNRIWSYGANASPAAAYAGIMLEDLRGGVVLGNLILGEGSAHKRGIWAGGTTPPQHPNIAHNQVSNMGLQGILLEAGTVGPICAGNHVLQTAGLSDQTGAILKDVSGNVVFP